MKVPPVSRRGVALVQRQGLQFPRSPSRVPLELVETHVVGPSGWGCPALTTCRACPCRPDRQATLDLVDASCPGEVAQAAGFGEADAAFFEGVSDGVQGFKARFYKA